MLKSIIVGACALLIIATPVIGHSVLASYYGGNDKLCGRPMANGHRLDCRQGVHTVAHRTLPFGSKVRVSYAGRTVDAVVTDRGPAKWTGRDLDLSLGTARDLGMVRAGVGRVQYEVTEMGQPFRRAGRAINQRVVQPTRNFFEAIFNVQKPAGIPRHKARGHRHHPVRH
jgi:rare lipoprotein A